MMKEGENDDDFLLQYSFARCYKEIFGLLTKTNNLVEPLCKVIPDYFQRNLKYKVLQSKLCFVRILFSPLKMNK